MRESRFWQEALARAAAVGFPGCYAFEEHRPPVTKLAENGVDLVIDEVATEALYAEDISGGK